MEQMRPFTETEMGAIEDALRCGWDCYYAFNKLACTNLGIDFKFYGIELYNALHILQSIKEYQNK